MTLKEQLQADLKQAMRSGDTHRRDVLRLLLAAIKQAEVDGGAALDDSGVEDVLLKQAKQRRETIADSERAGRSDLIEQERAELEVIEPYLPKMLSREEIEVEARKVIAETGASSPREMGQVMGRLLPRLKGQADGKLVSQVVRDLLQKQA